MKRYERLGLDEHLYKEAQARLGWASAEISFSSSVPEREAVAAARLALSVTEFRLVCRLLVGSRVLSTEERDLVRRVSAVLPPAKVPVAPVARGGQARRDVIAERSNDVVYVTTSGRSGAFHVRSDCPLLYRGQAAAATMGKEVWPVERMLQPHAEGEGHPPCTFCVPALGSAELLRSPPASTIPNATQRVSPPLNPNTASSGRKPASKAEAKREWDGAEAAILGVTVPQLKARRRAEQERKLARRHRAR